MNWIKTIADTEKKRQRDFRMFFCRVRQLSCEQNLRVDTNKLQNDDRLWNDTFCPNWCCEVNWYRFRSRFLVNLIFKTVEKLIFACNFRFYFDFLLAMRFNRNEKRPNTFSWVQSFLFVSVRTNSFVFFCADTRSFYSWRKRHEFANAEKKIQGQSFAMVTVHEWQQRTREKKFSERKYQNVMAGWKLTETHAFDDVKWVLLLLVVSCTTTNTHHSRNNERNEHKI